MPLAYGLLDVIKTFEDFGRTKQRKDTYNKRDCVKLCTLIKHNLSKRLCD